MRRTSLHLLLLVLVFACGSSRQVTQPTKANPQQQTSTTETPLDLELVDAELTDALVAVAGRAGINIFADADIDEAGRVTISTQSTPWNEVLAKIAADHRLRIEELDVRGADHKALWISRQSSPPAPVTQFTGDRITARFDDTPIRDVAKTIADFARTSIAVDDDVQANITLHLRLPWDLALYHLAQKYELRIVRSDRGIRISRR